MSKVADAFRRPLVLIETCASFFICKLATSCTCAWILQDARTSFPVRKPQEVLCGGIFEPQCNNFFAAQLKSSMNLYQWNGAEKSSKSRCICLQTKTTGVFFPFWVAFTFIDFIENFADKIVQQVRSKSSEAFCSVFESFSSSFGQFFSFASSL